MRRADEQTNASILQTDRYEKLKHRESFYPELKHYDRKIMLFCVCLKIKSVAIFYGFALAKWS